MQIKCLSKHTEDISENELIKDSFNNIESGLFDKRMYYKLFYLGDYSDLGNNKYELLSDMDLNNIDRTEFLGKAKEVCEKMSYRDSTLYKNINLLGGI